MKRKINMAGIRLYLLLWIILTFFLLYLIYDFDGSFLQQFIATSVVTGFTALPAYLSTNILVPELLYPKLIRKFIAALLLIAFANTLITYLIGGAFYYELSGKSIFSSIAIIQIIGVAFFVINCIVITVSCAIQIIIDRFGMEQQLHLVEDEKVITELAFLRAQINPHFLFNVLNTIYFQIQKENIEARNSVEKLSEMLRYHLYECTTDRVDISKELVYIENYITVQKLRMENGTDIQVSILGNIGSFKIAPFLILPLVENAFKHISNYKEPSQNKLYITMYVDNDSQFIVNVVNTYNPADCIEKVQNSSGLGLQNIERRLALLYPGKHLLTKKRHKNTYETILKIQFND